MSVDRDFVYALRAARRRPGRTGVMIAALTAGFGAAVAVLAVTYSVLLRPWPVADPDRLVLLSERSASARMSRSAVGHPRFHDWQTRARSFARLAAFEQRTIEIRGDLDTYEIAAHAVTPDFFPTLGIGAIRGRTLGQADRVLDDGTIPCVVSAGLERRLFPGGAVGRRFRLREGAGSESSATIVGVMPQGFERWSSPVDAWLPIDAPGVTPADAFVDVNRRTLTVVGRLKSGVTVAQAGVEMTALQGALGGNDVLVIPPRDAQVSPELRRSLWLLLITAALVLTAALANSTGILYASTLERHTELAVRRALGATSSGIARQLIVESLTLVGIAAAAGMTLAWWSLRVMAYVGAAEIASQTISVDAPVIGAAAAIVLVSGLGIGVVVTLRSRRARLFERLPHQSGRHAATRLWTTLVAIQAAVCVAIGGVGGAALHALNRLRAVDVGVDRQRIALITFQIRDDDTEMLSERARRTALLREIEMRVARLPQVGAAGFGSRAPLMGRLAAVTVITPEGHVFERREQLPVQLAVTAGFFSALGVSALRGRLFDDRDGRGAATVIVSDAFARQYWPGENAIGKRLAIGKRSNGHAWLEVVGVVRDVRYEGLREPIRPAIYSPLERGLRNPLTLAARTNGDPARLLGALRAEVIAARPSLRIVSTDTLEGVVRLNLGPERYRAWLLLGFSGLAWVLTTTAAAALAVYSTVQRRREFAIRLALGARRSVIVRLAAATAARGGVAGILAGLVVSSAIDPILARVVPGLDTTLDRLPLIVVTTLVAATVLLASYLPALLTHRVDPASVLRGE
jgi:predicted permease